jgi:hypothetical protein
LQKFLEGDYTLKQVVLRVERQIFSDDVQQSSFRKYAFFEKIYHPVGTFHNFVKMKRAGILYVTAKQS